MHACKHSILILVALLFGMAGSAVAADMPVGSMQSGTMQSDSMQPMEQPAADPDAQPLAFPTITAPGQPIEPVTPDVDAMATEDEEAPAPDAQAAEPYDVPAPAETGGPKSPTDKIVDKFMTLDTDESKSVSVMEYLVMVQQRVEARFKAMDANGDGEVTEEEYRDFWKSRMAKWYRLQR